MSGEIMMGCDSKKHTAIDAFCGAGGLSLGLQKAGFDVVGAFDINEKAVDTYRHNISEKCWVLDAKEIDGPTLLGYAGVDEIDLFAGGPPCQGFSKQKRGAHLGDDRNNLVLEFSRLVEELRPKVFMLENVAMFGQKRGKAFIEQIQQDLPHYAMFPHFYNSKDYGLAQTRERFVAVGVREDSKAAFRIPKPSAKTVTVHDAIGDLPSPPDDYSEHPAIPNHQKTRVTQINVKRFSFVPPGGGWNDIPDEYRLKCHKEADNSRGGWPDVYGRLEWGSQCPTITAGFDSFTRGRYGHPDEDRAITPREAARIQGFPDDFVFLGNKADVRRQIGNAVPPPLAEAIGKEMLRTASCFDSDQAAIPMRRSYQSMLVDHNG